MRVGLQTEKVIAECQSELGLIPTAAATALSDISVRDLDRDRLTMDTALVGRPIVGLVKQLRELIGPDLAQHVHFGTTTQDIMDTAMVMQMRAGLDAIDGKLAGIIAKLGTLASNHRDTPMVGRTNGQHARPIAFGLKLEVWSSELRRRRTAISDAAGRALMIQFGGPVGDLSAYGDMGSVLKKMVADRLGLGIAEPHWQNARDGVAECVTMLGLLCSSLSKIARNVNALSSSDIGELREKPASGKGASSSMTHKQNQRASEFAEAVGRLGRQRAGEIHEATLHDHERSGGAWITEWVTVPEVFLLCSGALLWVERLLRDLEIDTAQMNLNLQNHQRSLITPSLKS